MSGPRMADLQQEQAEMGVYPEGEEKCQVAQEGFSEPCFWKNWAYEHSNLQEGERFHACFGCCFDR